MDLPEQPACMRCHRPPRQALRRRLCEKCYFKAYRVGLLHLFPAQTSTAANTHARWSALVADEPGLSIRQAADLVAPGTVVQLGNGERLTVTGYSIVPVSKAYGNPDGDKVDVHLARKSSWGSTISRTSMRITAEVLVKIAAAAV